MLKITIKIWLGMTVWLSVLLLSFMGVVQASPVDKGAATPVKVIEVGGSSTRTLPDFAGQVAAGESALLAFRVPGQLQALHVRMGQAVTEGELLAELDNTDFKLAVDAREAEYQLAEVRAQRARKLFERKLISEDQLDQSQTRFSTAAASLEQAREQLSFTRLLAPFSGDIAFTYAEPSEVLAPGVPVLNIQDISTLEVHFQLPQHYQPLLVDAVAPTFSVSFNMLSAEALPASLDEVSLQPDTETNSYPVTLSMPRPENFSARPGMSTQVRMSHPKLEENVWALPAKALFEREGDNASVWIVDTETMTLTKARVVISPDNVVTSGLAAGSKVVVAGVGSLSEGQKVRAWIRQGGL
ncbi:MAG: efflux RND transporter periplasmic adaptor subunit [Candidatus Pelagadaptatus aseana]|uniref:efflux RND transporter periplasmic adaptor subunit n=1 Tax=Candidatus Pelagadaptatus aseana TaxID=3120508 RepID=UPI0039B19E59